MDGKTNDTPSCSSDSESDSSSDDFDLLSDTSSASSCAFNSASSFFSDADFEGMWESTESDTSSDESEAQIAIKNRGRKPTAKDTNTTTKEKLKETSNEDQSCTERATTSRECNNSNNIAVAINGDDVTLSSSNPFLVNEANTDTQEFTQNLTPSLYIGSSLNGTKGSDTEVDEPYEQQNGKIDVPYCDICGEIFYSQELLDVHKLSHLLPDLYPCSVCGHESKNREDYLIHSQTHDESNVSFQDLKKLKNKVKGHVCECGKSFQFLSGYKRHIASHEHSHTCSICNATFSSLLLCHQHKLKHIKKKLFDCKTCGKTFQRQYQLSGHMQVHEEDKKYACKECGMVYAYKTSLMRHRLKYHSPDSPKFQCDTCGEVFKSKKMLNGHTILHTAKKVIQCSECSQTFKYRSSYHRHKHIHQGKKPFRCNLCGNSFQDEIMLKSHKSAHFSNEAFVCKICEKPFAFERFLNQHMLSHDMGKADSGKD